MIHSFFPYPISLFILMAILYSIMWLCHIWFISSLSERPPGHFRFLPFQMAMNKTTMNTLVCVSCCTCESFSQKQSCWAIGSTDWSNLAAAAAAAFTFSRGVIPTQGSNPGLLHCRWILYQLSHKGSPRILEWVAYPFSSGSSQSRNQTRVSCISDGLLTIWATTYINFINKHIYVRGPCLQTFSSWRCAIKKVKSLETTS